jgi:mRNA-degrading endonuclease toxin of MazEF toxin-antitoxin module
VNRGDVYRIRMRLPDRNASSGATYRDKYVVALQGDPAFVSATEVAVVVASTHRSTGVRPFEVLSGAHDGFDHDTVIDCRWPFTLPKTQLIGGEYKFTLSKDRMREISLAIVHGLQLG